MPSQASTSDLRLAGKVALVIGAGSVAPGMSIGKATSLLLARHGARVAAADIKPGNLIDTLAGIRSGGGEAIGITMDVSDSDQIAAGVQEAVEAFGRIDILVNNVGLGQTGALLDTLDADWDRICTANLRGPYAACRAVIPHMLEQGGGSIVSTSSVAALRYVGYPHIAYSTTKAGLIQLMRVIALEHAADNIRANCVVPGLIDTPRVARNVARQFADDPEAARRRRGMQVPMGRMGEPADIAEAILFLAGDAARYITATEIVVDGGLTAQYGNPPVN